MCVCVCVCVDVSAGYEFLVIDIVLGVCCFLTDDRRGVNFDSVMSALVCVCVLMSRRVEYFYSVMLSFVFALF